MHHHTEVRIDSICYAKMPLALKHGTTEQKLGCMKTLLDDKRKLFICYRLRQRSEFSRLISATLTLCVVWSPPEDSPIYLSQTCEMSPEVTCSLQGKPTCLDQTRHFLGILILLSPIRFCILCRCLWLSFRFQAEVPFL